MKPIGYTVGKIHYELSQYETAIKIVNDEMHFYVGNDYEAGYNKRKYIENELSDILRAGAKDIQPPKPQHDEILNRAGID